MKRIIIIGEGPTEQEFCNDVLQPFFNHHGIYVHPATIKQSKGGIIPWPALKKEIDLHLLDRQAVVTTLVDYYGLYPKHNFPQWRESERIHNRSQRMDSLENAMKADISSATRYRFIPYIQLHEFEGILFSDTRAIEANFDANEFKDHAYLTQTERDFPNPEDINNGKHTAPSKRLDKILDSYDKVAYGSLLAQEIGLDKIREKCPRFNQWIEQLLQIKDL